MQNQNKSYLDIFLDNAEPKVRGAYFGAKQEQAIISFNSTDIKPQEKLRLFNEVIEPTFRRTINGVLEMSMFHYLGKINRDELIDATFFRMIEKMHKFQPGMIGKSGQPVKAFSYFSTIAKNFILEFKVRYEKVQKHKADVESSIDLSILSEETLEKMSNQDKNGVSFDNAESVFNETSLKIIAIVDDIIREEEKKEDKMDMDLLKIGYTLKYLIKKWDKIEFMKKNEFMRILALYTGLKQQRVSFLFKKFKTAVLEILSPNLIKTGKIIDDDDDDEKPKKKKTKIIDAEQVVEEIEEVQEEDETSRICSTEDFDIYEEREANKKIKTKWLERKKK